MSDNNKNIPSHVAIIMDGNGRWAKERGLDRLRGHAEGVSSVKKSIVQAIKSGVGYVTVYAFSKENWKRSKEEVNGLMELFCKTIVSQLPELIEQGVKLNFIGDFSELSDDVCLSINKGVQSTQNCDRLVLTIALNYSSRWEIVEAARSIAHNACIGNIDVDQIDETFFEKELNTYPLPDPDLIIRTSGEMRLSNFMLWQAAYSEFYFTEVMWPDFDENEFQKAIDYYSKRNRRFGNAE